MTFFVVLLNNGFIGIYTVQYFIWFFCALVCKLWIDEWNFFVSVDVLINTQTFCHYSLRSIGNFLLEFFIWLGRYCVLLVLLKQAAVFPMLKRSEKKVHIATPRRSSINTKSILLQSNSTSIILTLVEAFFSRCCACINLIYLFLCSPSQTVMFHWALSYWLFNFIFSGRLFAFFVYYNFLNANLKTIDCTRSGLCCLFSFSFLFRC